MVILNCIEWVVNVPVCVVLNGGGVLAVSRFLWPEWSGVEVEGVVRHNAKSFLHERALQEASNNTILQVHKYCKRSRTISKKSVF